MPPKKKLVIGNEFFTYILILMLWCPLSCIAAPNLLRDVNRDGFLKILAFGDSITRGTGDSTTNALKGFPGRLQKVLSVPVDSEGIGGETAIRGLTRLKKYLPGSDADIVVLDYGNSDAYEPSITPSSFRIALDSAVHSVKAVHKIAVLANQYPTCCRFGGHASQLNAINRQIGIVAHKNGIRVADLDLAWRTTCDKLPNCNLLFTDGLHPNRRGYDVIAETILATVSGIEIFQSSGLKNLKSAFKIPASWVDVKPYPIN